MPINQSQQMKLDQGREYRNVVMAVRARSDDEESFVVEGYATTFNQPYELYRYGSYSVWEQVDSHAFDDCDMTDVIMQFDHTGRVYARTRNNTLDLKTDSRGLYIVANLGGTEEGRKLYQEIKSGYVDRMSFGFAVGEDSRTYIEDRDAGTEKCLRTILKITKLYDVSAVSIPANDMTSISARSYADGVLAQRAEERRREKEKRLKLTLLLEGI